MTAEAAFADMAPPRPPAFPLGASVVVSALLHVGLVGALLFGTSIFHPAPLLQPQTIHVKLARIGTPRDKRLLPRRPDEPSSRAAAPIPLSASHAVEVASTHHPKLTAKQSKSPEDQLRNALAKLKQQVDDQTGDPNGFQTGTDDVTEGDLYNARVVDRIRRFYQVPNTISQAECAKLTADVEISLAADGTILDQKTQASSGNRLFDRAIEDAVKKCRALPAPPPAVAQQWRDGVVLEFVCGKM